MCLAGTSEAVRGHHHAHAHVTSDGARAAAPEQGETGGRLSRRALLGAGVGASLAALLPAAPASARGRPGPGSPGRRVADLSHVFTEVMPTYGEEKPSKEVISGPFAEGEFGFYNQRWTFTEHVGTHLDAPGHVIGGGRLTPDLRVDELVVPAVVVDIRDKAAEDPNATVSVADLVAFERRHGRIPQGSAVLMDSGWAARWRDGDLAYRGTDSLDEWPFSFPGFSADAAEWLISRRDVVGVGVDTLSTDPGDSTDFPAHEVLGRADRWGLENLTNLDGIPARGATLVVGLVSWDDASGGPCRALATW